MDTTQPVVIKKYPNRRLYDTSQSKYVNLEYIRQLILEHRDFQVVDSKSGEDLTKSVLLQIISESETSQSQSLLTDTLLKQLICFYGSDMQSFVPQYLEDSLTRFLSQQEKMRGMMKDLVAAGPLGLFGKMVEQNIEAWNRFNRPDGTPDDESRDK
ncbi:polyhydroxyalkanoate synthesis repressor PhaR [Marinobacter sp. X15-166B]|uniref:polyhydroxyalkanoate synthesis repressor PhaR n=1 Tax=Marinobacter sp. X15-166B TaxID=1897620 RepID=UPI00085C863A|nr:polyhydroxyalkanoate synthesis repressor PhaR [Marinobacter sp. X15-166B]OEY65695.1 polyhydroxyalkanoate synthesis repressor PhaR [Marinobacter sp. X15-166B]